jgi:hypothetical protein
MLRRGRACCPSGSAKAESLVIVVSKFIVLSIRVTPRGRKAILASDYDAVLG